MLLPRLSSRNASIPWSRTVDCSLLLEPKLKNISLEPRKTAAKENKLENPLFSSNNCFHILKSRIFKDKGLHVQTSASLFRLAKKHSPTYTGSNLFPRAQSVVLRNSYFPGVNPNKNQLAFCAGYRPKLLKKFQNANSILEKKRMEILAKKTRKLQIDSTNKEKNLEKSLTIFHYNNKKSKKTHYVADVKAKIESIFSCLRKKKRQIDYPVIKCVPPQICIHRLITRNKSFNCTRNSVLVFNNKKILT